MPYIDYCVQIDSWTVAFDVSPQEVLIKDFVIVMNIDTIAYYRIKEPSSAVKIVEKEDNIKGLFIFTLKPNTKEGGKAKKY